MLERLKKGRERLAKARRQVAFLQEQYDALLQEWQVEHAELIDQLELCRQRLDCADVDLRGLLVQHFDQSGDKHPLPGLGVRVCKALTYDPGQAIRWSIDHEALEMLRLDKRGFEKYAKAAADTAMALEWVTIEAVPTATISSDLEED